MQEFKENFIHHDFNTTQKDESLGKSITQLTFTYSDSTIETVIKMCEICSKLTIKTVERRHHSIVFVVNFEHILHLYVVFLLLKLNK